MLPMKNKYKLLPEYHEKKLREILKYFCLDLEAVKIAEICHISRNSVHKIIKSIRILMLQECEKLAKLPNKTYWRNRNR